MLCCAIKWALKLGEASNPSSKIWLDFGYEYICTDAKASQLRKKSSRKYNNNRSKVERPVSTKQNTRWLIGVWYRILWRCHICGVAVTYCCLCGVWLQQIMQKLKHRFSAAPTFRFNKDLWRGWPHRATMTTHCVVIKKLSLNFNLSVAKWATTTTQQAIKTVS